MTQERADEILRMVIYANLSNLPYSIGSADAFQVGLMIGKMQRQLETELAKEVKHDKEGDA